MRKRFGRVAMVFSQSVLIFLVMGCASSPSESKTPPKEVPPIDRVREGLVSLKDQISKTTAAAVAVAAEPVSGVPQKRETFSRERRATETHVETLRANATELQARASEYLTIWGGKVVSFQPNAGGLASEANQPRERMKATYDAMVAAAIAARDAMAPLRASYDKLEAAYQRNLTPADVAALQPDLRAVSANSQTVTTHLETAVSKLDELKSLAAANASGSAQPK